MSNKLQLAILFLLALASAAYAGDGMDCSYITASPVYFGNYSKESSPLDGAGTVTVRVRGNRPYAVKMDTGRNSDNYRPRYLSSGKDELAYNLFIDKPRTMIWGDGTEDTYFRTNSCEGTFPVYGRIPANQDPPPGEYSDSIMVTIEW